MKERIIDGAMGTSTQKYKSLTDFRGEQWKNHTHDLKGDNDCLVVTRPDIIGEIHGGMLETGTDIIETNTFNGTTISQADYALQDLKHVNLINTEGVKLAKRVCAEWTAKTPNKPRFVAGAIGPTNRTLSVSPSVENPAYRNCTYDEVVQAYIEQAEGLYAGGVDLFLVVFQRFFTASSDRLLPSACAIFDHLLPNSRCSAIIFASSSREKGSRFITLGAR